MALQQLWLLVSGLPFTYGQVSPGEGEGMSSSRNRKRKRGKPKSKARGSLTVLQPRECGSCSACCHVLPVDDVNTVFMDDCQHQMEGGGCSIYDARPLNCRGFQCFWLMLDELCSSPLWQKRFAKFLGIDYRPDKLGAMVEMLIVPKLGGADVAFDVSLASRARNPMRDNLISRLMAIAPVAFYAKEKDGNAFCKRGDEEYREYSRIKAKFMELVNNLEADH